ncbi:MAG TPA: hypothetical protein VJZ25_05875, partial [Gemmatimonadaceae bacterium]|nr:hypothetical protein [Gemmatimonadaceae bacterium]
LFRHGNISLTIPPGILIRDQLLLLRLIKDSMHERPIYLSTGGGQGLGLEPYLLSQGFVQKIVENPIVESPATPRISGLFLDVERTRTLWNDVYRAPEALIKEGDWVDRPSFGIAYTYAFTGAILAEALARQGDEKGATAIMDRVKKIVKAARIEGFPGA